MDALASTGLHALATAKAADPRLSPPSAEADDAALLEAAQAFEKIFLAEMLKHAEVDAVPSGFSGGYGEEAFRSFLLAERAEALSASSDFGLAEAIYAQLKEKAADHGQ